MKKKLKWLAILVIICLLLLTIFVIFICHGKKDQNKKNQQEGFSLEEVIKNPEYSLDELYDIIEEPEKFYELTEESKNKNNNQNSLLVHNSLLNSNDNEVNPKTNKNTKNESQIKEKCEINELSTKFTK